MNMSVAESNMLPIHTRWQMLISAMMSKTKLNQTMLKSFKKKLYVIIFEADTPAGKLFDISILVIILLSIVSLILESVKELQPYSDVFDVVEWVITAFFTAEYVLRLWIVQRPIKYAISFFGLIDLLSLLPTYLGLVLPGDVEGFLVVRALRLLRVFRILKLSRYVSESRVIIEALAASRTKISVFLYAVITMVIVLGTIMYFIEGEENGFESIPHSIYWAVVTLTTVGYGDIAPATALGRFIAGVVMILGYAIIAVPTGIVSSELTTQKGSKSPSQRICPACSASDHDENAKFCKHCGHSLDE